MALYACYCNNYKVKPGDGSTTSDWGKRLWSLEPNGGYFTCADCGAGFTPCPALPHDPAKEAEMQRMMRGK